MSTVPWEGEEKQGLIMFPKWKWATEARKTAVSLYLAEEWESDAQGSSFPSALQSGRELLFPPSLSCTISFISHVCAWGSFPPSVP